MGLSMAGLVEMLRGAGEPTRARLLALLAREELSVLELCRILDQSQPRVSRHLKLLTEAGLIERFPDGAWVFYRLGEGDGRKLVSRALDLLDPEDACLTADAAKLGEIHAERAERADAYFSRNAARWDQIRSLYVDEREVDTAVNDAAGEGPIGRLVDLGVGAGAMLSLLGPRARTALGLDLSQQMLNIARANLAKVGLGHLELRHGDIFATRLPDASADLVTVHQVLHYLSDPGAAVAEAARLVDLGGRLVIVDFAPHDIEGLRANHQHRRLGFSDQEIRRWLSQAGLKLGPVQNLPPRQAGGLTVKIWTGQRIAKPLRSAA
ncbi:MAG: ArsR family transcriptional regulator [Caulobacteraceae bacterium]|nr:ArsR family transcriptional regulator [Caulobacteraceae bacterium]